MTPTVSQAESIFLALADLDPAARDALLAARCGGDARLRAEVEAMLAAVDIPDDFLDPEQVPTLDPAGIDGPLEPGARLGDYLVLHALGSGGMGVVYAAQQDRPRRTVAIKVLHRSARRREVAKRFELEAELLGRLQHPGIAQVYAFHAGDRLTPAYLVMELVPGPPITEYAQAHDLPYMARVALGARVCDAIHHAHERGIVHRDLTPANVLMSDDGQPKILDFGIARAAGLDLQLSTIQTLHGQLIGTLAYMSPEQVSADPLDVDTRSDVYSAGVLMYRLLSGRLPVDLGRVPFAEALRRALEDTPVPLGLTDADLRGPLEQIIGRAMASDRDRRYPTAAAFAADLQAYVEGRPLSIGGGKMRAGSAIGRHARRQTRTISAVAASVIALTLFGGYTLVERRRSDAVASQLRTELSASRIEQGRLLAASGRLENAEALLWPEYFQRPGNDAVRWALRDLYAHQPVLWTAAAHAGAARVARFTFDDRHIVTGGDDGGIAVWNAETGRPERRIDAHAGSVRALDILQSREWLVSGGDDGVVRAWRLADGGRVREFTGHRGGIRSVTASPSDDRLASCDQSGVLRLWPSLDADAPLTVERAGAHATIARFSVNGARLIVAWDDGTVELRDARTAKHLSDTRAGGGPIASLAQSSDGHLLVTAGNDGSVGVWDASTLRPVSALAATRDTILGAAFSPDGRTLAVAESRQIELWDTRSWRRGKPLGRAQRWLDVAFSQHGDRLATAGDGGTLRVWDPRGAAVVESEQLTDGDAAALAVQRMAGAGSGRPFKATVGSDGALRILSAADGRLLMTPLERDVAGRLAAVRPDGRVAAAWDDGRVDVVDVDSFDQFVRGSEAYQRSHVPRP